jgi:eukaryotic-like serine/threonine-protein kinase
MSQETLSPAGIQEDSYEFGAFRIDVASRALFRGDEFIPLTPKSFDILLVLVKEAGKVVTKEELMRRVWPDAFVEEGSITNNISALRKILNEDPDGEGPIATVPRRGYRFTSAVRLKSAKSEIAVRAPSVDGAADAGVQDLYPKESGLSPAIKISAAVMGSLLILGIAAYNLYFVSGHGRHAITEKDTIVITDFTNKTPDAVFDDTLKQALIFDLEQSPRLSIVSDRRIASTLQMMGRSPEDRVTGEIARELCIRVGSKAMLTGTISALDNQYVIGLQAINCATGDALVAEQARASGRTNVLNALDEGASRLRGKLGESLDSVQKYSLPINEFTTSSLEALKAYGIGQKITSGRGDLPALPYLQRAVELDDKFAAAYSGLSLAYENVGQAKRSLEAAAKAYALRNRVTEPERFRIEGSYYLNVTGQLEEGVKSYDMWAHEYPREAPAYNNMGFANELMGNLEDARKETVIAMQLEPSSSKLMGNLAQLQIALNEFDEAQKTTDAGLKIVPDTFELRLPAYQLAFLRGDAAAMQSETAWGETHPGDGDWILNSEGDTEAYCGKIKLATARYERAIDSVKKSDDVEMAAEWQAKDAMVEAEMGNASEARRYANEAMATAPGRVVRTYVALAYARIGDTAEAKKLVEGLNKEFPLDTLLQKYWLPTIHASIEMHAGLPEDAIQTLKPLGQLDYSLSFPLDYGTMYPTYVRGLAYLGMGKGTEAAAQFQRMLDQRGLVINFPLAGLANLQLARAYAMNGDKDKARAAYKDFLTTWKDADADVPVLQQAKKEVAAL